HRRGPGPTPGNAASWPPHPGRSSSARPGKGAGGRARSRPAFRQDERTWHVLPVDAGIRPGGSPSPTPGPAAGPTTDSRPRAPRASPPGFERGAIGRPDHTGSSRPPSLTGVRGEIVGGTRNRMGVSVDRGLLVIRTRKPTGPPGRNPESSPSLAAQRTGGGPGG